jgi:hypothetical protein
MIFLLKKAKYWRNKCGKCYDSHRIIWSYVLFPCMRDQDWRNSLQCSMKLYTFSGVMRFATKHFYSSNIVLKVLKSKYYSRNCSINISGFLSWSFIISQQFVFHLKRNYCKLRKLELLFLTCVISVFVLFISNILFSLVRVRICMEEAVETSDIFSNFLQTQNMLITFKI